MSSRIGEGQGSNNSSLSRNLFDNNNNSLSRNVFDSKSNALSLGNSSNSLTLGERSGLQLTSTFQSSSAAASASMSALSKNTSQLMSQAFDSGALSVREDREMLEKVKNILNSTSKQIIEERQNIDKGIQKFHETSDQFNKQCSTYAMELSKKIIEKKGVITEEEKNSCSFLILLAQQIGNRFFETANQMMDLQKLNSEGKLRDYKGVIDLIVYSRTQELELLGKRLELLRTQSDYELKVMTTIQNEELKGESIQFDNILKVAEFNSKENQKDFDNHLKLREEKHKEEQDLKELLLKEHKIDQEVKLQELKLKNDKEIEQAKIKSNSEIEHHRIRAEERVQWAKTAATLVKPATKCTIM